MNALTAHNNAQVAKLQLYQTIGVPADIDAKLTTTFAVAQPTFKLDRVARPGAARQSGSRRQEVARVRESSMNVSVAQASYLPSLNLSTGYGANAFGYANSDILAQQAQAQRRRRLLELHVDDSLRAGAGLKARGCGSATLSRRRSSTRPARRTSRSSSTRRRIGLTASLSMPIFNGFAREQNVEQARVRATTRPTTSALATCRSRPTSRRRTSTS